MHMAIREAEIVLEDGAPDMIRWNWESSLHQVRLPDAVHGTMGFHLRPRYLEGLGAMQDKDVCIAALSE